MRRSTMSRSTVFSCPSCAAQLRADGTQYQVECPYCGSLVTVPAELRRPDVAPPPVIVQVAAPVAAPAPMVYRRPARRSSCFGFLVTLLFLLVAGAAALGWYQYNNGAIAVPNVVPNLIGTGDGQLQQTFGGAGTGP